MLQIIKNYRENAALRHSFNALAMDTFGIDFEDWYQNGYWTDRYIPYSVLIDGEVAANVSVNRTWFELGGERKHYLQLGTVMTAEDCRNQGLIRLLKEEIDLDYAGKVDGIYLFAGDDVLAFYPKFGFRAMQQYEYVRQVAGESEQRAGEPVCQDPPCFVQTPLRDKTAWDMLEQRIRVSHHQAALEMLDNSQLNMFYVSKYMQDNVYYCESSDTYVIAERDGDSLVIHMVISDREQDLCQIADGLVASLADSIRDSEGVELRLVKLGFTPKDPHGFVCRELDQEDCMFFGKGDLTVIETEKLMFPSLAHA